MVHRTYPVYRHTSYLSPISSVGYAKKILSCGEISEWQMWINLKFLHVWHVFHKEKVSTYMCIWCCFVVKLVLSRFTLYVAKSVLMRFMLFCVENNWTKLRTWKKVTNMRYVYRSNLRFPVGNFHEKIGFLQPQVPSRWPIWSKVFERKTSF